MSATVTIVLFRVRYVASVGRKCVFSKIQYIHKVPLYYMVRCSRLINAVPRTRVAATVQFWV